MNAELINEFYLLQQSRSNAKYLDVLDDEICQPFQVANKKVTSWMHKRGKMLMTLEKTANLRMARFRKKYLKR